MPRDWIIRGVAGEHYPCLPEVFSERYEEVEEGANVTCGEPTAVS
jgi:hypothetical protein